MRTRRPSVDVMERDAQAADLYRRGLTYRQIAAQMGYKSPQSVGDAIRRAAQSAAGDALASVEALQMMLDRLQDYRRLAWRVATTKHYATMQSGKVATHPETGAPVLDDGPVLSALDRLLRADQEESRLRGLYAPVKSRVEVITEDVVDAELAALARQVAENDARAAHTGTA